MTVGFPTPATSSRASGSFSSWAEGLLPGCTWPRKSTWAGGWSPSRSHGPRGTNLRSLPGSSTRTSCRCTRSADDPASGLRILCMPYFGGANLAQVLEAVGGLAPTHHDGRSLVAALDQVSRNVPSVSSRAMARGSSRRSRPGRSNRGLLAGTRPPFQPPAVRTASRPRDFDRCFRAGSARARPAASPGALEHDDAAKQDSDQPSRQFLHGATPSRRRSGSSRDWPTGSSTPTRAVCCTAT